MISYLLVQAGGRRAHGGGVVCEDINITVALATAAACINKIYLIPLVSSVALSNDEGSA